MYVIVYPNPDNEFLLDILNLYIDFIKFIIEKLESNTQVFPNPLECFPITKLITSSHTYFYFKCVSYI